MPSTVVACAGDRSNLLSPKVISQTHNAAFGGCHRVNRPSEERNHQEGEVRRADTVSIVAGEVTSPTYPDSPRSGPLATLVCDARRWRQTLIAGGFGYLTLMRVTSMRQIGDPLPATLECQSGSVISGSRSGRAKGGCNIPCGAGCGPGKRPDQVVRASGQLSSGLAGLAARASWATQGTWSASEPVRRRVERMPLRTGQDRQGSVPRAKV